MISNMKYKMGLAAMAVVLLTGCDDQIMQWGTPDGHAGVTSAEIPLQVKYSLLYLLGPSLIPEIGPDVPAGTSCHIHL